MAKPKKSKGKKSAGALIIEGLTEFLDALKAGEPLDERFIVRTVPLDKTDAPEVLGSLSRRRRREDRNVR